MSVNGICGIEKMVVEFIYLYLSCTVSALTTF